jgi:hypothetical protein
MPNLIRVSKAKEHDLPVKSSTLYKWKHKKKYPEIFIKVGGFLFVDLDALEQLFESGRQKNERLTIPRRLQ